MKYKDINWDEIRSQFPVASKKVYLDAAEASPIPNEVVRAGSRYYEDMSRKGILNWDYWESSREKTRKGVSDLINADKEEIAFVGSTSHGMNILSQMLMGSGAVVTMEDEYPASTIPWIHHGYRVRFVKPVNQKYPIEEIEKIIKKDTRILVNSHVQFSTGFCQDLEAVGKLCKQHNLIHVVNSTQSFGVIPINVKDFNVDFMCFSGYKWAFSGFGEGCLYINSKWFGKVKYPEAGGESVENWDSLDNRTYTLKQDAAELEVGTVNYPGIITLGAGIEFINRIGTQNIKRRISELNNYLIESVQKLGIRIVSPLGQQHRSAITVLDIPRPSLVVKQLEEDGIIVSKRTKGLRVSIHIYNSESDIDRFIASLRHCI